MLVLVGKKWNVRSAAFTVVQLLLFQSVDICGASLDMAWPKKQHYSGSGHMWAAHYAELRCPLTAPAVKLQRKQKESESSKWCLFCVCRHGGLPSDAFILSLSDATVPRGGDVTARSMSNMKEGKVAAKDLWGENHFNKSVEGTMWQFRLNACTSWPVYCQRRPRGHRMQIVNHMLLFTSLSLFVSSLSLSGT